MKERKKVKEAVKMSSIFSLLTLTDTHTHTHTHTHNHSLLLNALIKQNPSLLDKSLCPLVLLPQCRAFLDFENKKAYFRSQVCIYIHTHTHTSRCM
jgi:hypothetical protein